MYKLSLNHKADEVKKIAEDLDYILKRCGFTYKMSTRLPLGNYYGGSIVLKYLNHGSAGRRLGFVFNNQLGDYSRLEAMLSRWYRKPIFGRKFPRFMETQAAKVRCSHQLHSIYLNRKGRFGLERHPLNLIDADRAMSALALSSKPPRCLQVWDWWRKHKESNLKHVNLPTGFSTVFQRNKKVKTARKNRYHKIDHLTLPLKERARASDYRQKAYNILASCVYDGNASNAYFEAVNVTVTDQSNYIAARPANTDDRYPTVESTVNQRFHYYGKHSGNNRPYCTLKVDIPYPGLWYAMIGSKGFGNINNNFVTRICNIIDNNTLLVKAIRLDAGKFSEQYALLKKETCWHLDWIEESKIDWDSIPTIGQKL